MTTKATRDVIDLCIRPVLNACIEGGNIDNTPIGVTVPNEGHFTNLFADNITINPGGFLDITNVNIIGTIPAYYADIAENYESDKEYEAGTLVSFDGEKEITITTFGNRQDVFGVVSAEPAMVLNSDQEGIALPVALIGRVPVKMIGAVKKGQRIRASSYDGRAIAFNEGDDASLIVGRSVVDAWVKDSHQHVIEAVVSLVK